MSKTTPFPLPVVGIDSLSNETALAKNTVREAINVDIGRAGRFKRRDGFSPRLNGVGYHSLYRANQKGWTLVAQDTQLYRLDISDYSLTLLAQLKSPDPLTYTEYNGNIYWSNKTTIGWIPSNSILARDVGVASPSVTPTLSISVGALLPGKYAVTLILIDDRGEQSGTCALQTINLPDGGGIKLEKLPIIGPTFSLQAFITSADGEILRVGATFPAIFPTYTITDQPAGAECDTLGLVPLPPGDIIRWHAGRLYTASNGALRFSEALRPHLYNPAHGIIPFSGHIAFVEAVVDGIYVGDSRGVWFLDGTDPTKFSLKQVSTCRAVTRSSIIISPESLPEKKIPTKNPVAIWLSTSGYVVGMEGGTTVELHPMRIKVPPGLVGRTTFLLRKGIKQVITPVNSTSTAVLGTAVDSII